MWGRKWGGYYAPTVVRSFSVTSSQEWRFFPSVILAFVCDSTSILDISNGPDAGSNAARDWLCSLLSSSVPLSSTTKITNDWKKKTLWSLPPLVFASLLKVLLAFPLDAGDEDDAVLLSTFQLNARISLFPLFLITQHVTSSSIFSLVLG